jgi:hypothetical protein
MFVGYCLNHAGDTVRMWDPDTKRVHLSRDIMWTGRMYFDSMQKMLEGPFIHSSLKNENNDEINDEIINEKKEIIKILMLRRKQSTRQALKMKVTIKLKRNQIKSSRNLKDIQMIWEQQM